MSDERKTTVGTSRLHGLDFLRGVAILAVLTIHGSKSFPVDSEWINSALRVGNFGVHLFYLVSALTMCYMWELRSGELAPVRSFYIRRFFRIAPLFWLAIPAYLLVNGVGMSYWAPDGIHTLQIVLTATFLHGFWPDSINSVVPGGWSIAIEMTFYIVFPFLIIWLRERASAYLLAGYLLFVLNILLIRPSVSAFLSAHYSTSSDWIIRDYLHFYFPNQVPIFLIGCYLYFSQGKPRKTQDKLTVLAWLVTAFFLPVDFKNGYGFVSMYFLLAAFVALCLKIDARNPMIELLGRQSYGIYLSHFLVFSSLTSLLPTGNKAFAFLTAMLITIPCSYCLAKILNHTVEEPIQRWARRFTAGTRTQNIIA